MVFFCQNNQYAISAALHQADGLAHRGAEGPGLRHVRRAGGRQRRVRGLPGGVRGARPGPDRPRADPHRGLHLPGDRPHHVRRRPALPGRTKRWQRGGSATPSSGWRATCARAGLLDEAGEAEVLAEADRQVAEAVAAFEAIAPPGPGGDLRARLRREDAATGRAGGGAHGPAGEEGLRWRG